MVKVARFLMAISIIVSGIAFSPPTAQAKSCPDVEFIFARGSGESLGDDSMTAWRASIEAELQDSSLTYDFYELGSAEQGGFSYPAVAVAGSTEGYFNLLGAVVSGGESLEFGASVVSGSRELQSYITQTSRACPDTHYVLGGYSQGAMVVSRTLPSLDADKIVYAATFGDPKLYLPEGKGIVPAACLGRDFSNYRAYVPDCRAYEGVLGSYRPYQSTGYLDKLGAWCNTKDVMCSSGVSLKDHTAYVSSGLYRQAAAKIKQQLSQAYPSAVSESATDHVTHNLAIIIDSTDSMGPMIQKYKTEARKLAQQIFATGGKVALFEYRDLADPFTTVQHCDYTCTYEEFSARLDAITTANGGDEPESALSAIYFAMNSLKWQVGATKSIVLLTNAAYLSPDRDGVSLADVTRRSLEIDPVNVYVITRGVRKDDYLDLVRQTGGKVFSIGNELELSSEYILNRPVALLSSESYFARPGDTITFDASDSYDLGGTELSYDWDLDGDGNFEFIDAASRLDFRYSELFSGHIQVRVHNRSGRSSTMSARVDVATSSMFHPPTLTVSSVSQLDSDRVRIKFTTDAEKVLVIADDAILGYIDARTQQDFILRDLASVAEFKLVPCSDSIRGTAQTVPISLPASTISTPHSVSTDLAASSVPTAPNAGVAQ